MERVAIIACGALAREIMAVLGANGLDHVTLKCLPALLHNHPDKIPGAVAEAITALKPTHDRIMVAYGDCGTGGTLDRVLDAHGVSRIEGPHCYSFFTGNDVFANAGNDDMRTFYLTDFLARQFDALIVRALGLDRHPELLPTYFGNYTTLAYLAQTDDGELDHRAEAAAAFLGLTYERRAVGYGDLSSFVAKAAEPQAPTTHSLPLAAFGTDQPPALHLG